MKICYLADSESIHTKRWCAHFHALGHEVHLISLKPSPIENIHFHHVDAGDISVGGGNKRVLFLGKKVRKLVKKINPDILHAHYATSYGWLGARSGFHPFVVTALGTDVLLSPANSRLYRIMLRYVFRKADSITLMADHMKEIVSRYDLGDLNKFSVVPFGIDTSIFNSDNRKLSSDSFIITSTRNFEDVYNIPHLLKSVSKVKEKIPGLKLKLIGDGSRRKNVEQLVNELGLAGITEFFGRIPQLRIAEVLNQSHLFITVSLSDGNNISLNEAMSCGAYCIATDIPANTQWINDQVNGRLVKINDVDGLSNAILETQKNYSTIIDEVNLKNRKIIEEKADWKVNMKKVETLYQELCKK
jgi:glycosyltransferase involved in cell wall biosynthesis